MSAVNRVSYLKRVPEMGQTWQLWQTAPRCLLGFSRSAAEQRSVLRLLLEQLLRDEALPAHRTPHHPLMLRQSLVVRPHLHAGDVDIDATAEPDGDKDRTGHCRNTVSKTLTSFHNNLGVQIQFYYM